MSSRCKIFAAGRSIFGNTISDVVQLAKKLGVESLNDTMTNPWLEAFLFLDKQAVEGGFS